MGTNSVNIILIRRGVQTETQGHPQIWDRDGMEWCMEGSHTEAGERPDSALVTRNGPGPPWLGLTVREQTYVCRFKPPVWNFQPQEINEGSEGLRGLFVTVKSGSVEDLQSHHIQSPVLCTISASWSSYFYCPGSSLTLYVKQQRDAQM